MSALLIQLQDVTTKAVSHPNVMQAARVLLETIVEDTMDEEKIGRSMFDLVAMVASITASDTAYAILGEEEMDKIIDEAMALELIGKDNES